MWPVGVDFYRPIPLFWSRCLSDAGSVFFSSKIKVMFLTDRTSFSENPVLLDTDRISYLTYRKENDLNVVTMVLNGILIEDCMRLDDNDLEELISRCLDSLRI